MKKPFTDAELVIINEMNEADLGELVERLSPIELLRLKSGEGLSLKMILKGRALLEVYRARARGEDTDVVRRRELDILTDEHNNLAVKTMLIFMALKKRGLISDADLEEAAAEIRENRYKEPNDGRTDDTSKKKRTRRKRTALDPDDEDISGASSPRTRTRGSFRVRLRPKKDGKDNDG